ncbi:MAG: hypothetical protein J6W19_05150 [Prevotella sp.]|nr:hypothetical protein [Prevotella sp.]
MKKVFLMVVASMMATMSINAQDEWQNEISVAYGAGSNTDIVSSIGVGMFSGKQTSYWGPVSLEYFRYVQSRLAIGAVAAVGGCSWENYNNASSTYYTLMPAVKYNWLVKSHFGMYSKVAAGITMGVESDDDNKKDDTLTTFNWQASLLGMEFGGAFRGFVELGLGEQGIILGGLRYKF